LAPVLQRLHIEGFKAYEAVTIPMRPFTVLIGPNGAGKTTILEAIHTAIAIPCRMIESWALGDREALAGLLSVQAAELDYAEPEDLWGDEDDPESAHPKCVWRRVTEERIEFAEIGEAVAPAALAKTCPDSFPPFAEDVDRALRACRRRGPTTKPARARRRTR
jgi:DNA repair ATPase RecN